MADRIGALSQLAKMLVGHSLPADAFDIGAHDLLRSLTLPDERLLYHSGDDPIYQLKNQQLWTAYHPRLSRMFLNKNGYVTPFVAQDDAIERLYDSGMSSDITKPYGRSGIQQGQIWAPKELNDPESLRDWNVGLPSALPYSLVPEVYTPQQGALTPLSRRLTGEHARGGLI